jgi:hypothetical protein
LDFVSSFRVVGSRLCDAAHRFFEAFFEAQTAHEARSVISTTKTYNSKTFQLLVGCKGRGALAQTVNVTHTNKEYELFQVSINYLPNANTISYCDHD